MRLPCSILQFEPRRAFAGLRFVVGRQPPLEPLRAMPWAKLPFFLLPARRVAVRFLPFPLPLSLTVTLPRLLPPLLPTVTFALGSSPAATLTLTGGGESRAIRGRPCCETKVALAANGPLGAGPTDEDIPSMLFGPG